MSQTNSTQWHYLVGSEQKGPHTRDQMAALVRAGTVGSATLVWSDGMAGWLPLPQSPLAHEIALPGARPDAPPPPMPPPAAGRPTGGPGGGYIAPSGAAQAASERVAAAGAALSAVAGGGAAGDFVGAVTTCLTKYVTFSGRAARPELWYFVLFGILVNIAATIVDTALVYIGIWFSPLGTLIALALLLPYLAVASRRLHDIDKSAWWLLIGLVPVVGFIVLIVFYCTRGTPGRNRFG